MPLSTIDTSSISGLGYGFKNRIINGGMVVDQRNVGASVSMSTGSNVFPVDRFQGAIAQGSGHTAQQSTSAPAGFTNSLLVTIGTGASPTAGQVARLYQPIEGFNTADLGFGFATASTITLSFWVRSSLTGTFAGGVYNNAANRTYVFTYAISAANTWEQKTVTIAGDTSGTWLTNNGAGILVNWDLGTGSTYQGTAGVWAAGAAWATSGSVKLAATSGATWSITGVQLEAGTVATSFDWRPYGTELQLCQRYYTKETGYNVKMGSRYGANTVFTSYMTPVEMRTTPSVASSTTNWSVVNTTASENSSASTINTVLSYVGGNVDIVLNTSFNPAQYIYYVTLTAANTNLTFSAEL